MSKVFELGALVTFKDGSAPCVVIDRRETADGLLEYKVESRGVQLSWLPPDALEPRKKKSTDDLARLQAENKRLRDALKTVLRKANSLAGYYPEPGDEREAYGMDAPIVFDDIRKAARVALEGGREAR